TTEETGAGSRSGRPGDSGRRRVDQVRRRRLVATEEAALPVLEAIDLVVVRELRGAADEDAVANLFLIVVLHPPVARLAERNFVPLARLVIIAGLRQFFTVPHALDTVLENVPHGGRPEAIEAAESHRSVVVD